MNFWRYEVDQRFGQLKQVELAQGCILLLVQGMIEEGYTNHRLLHSPSERGS